MNYEHVHAAFARSTADKLAQLEGAQAVLIVEDTTPISDGLRDIEGVGFYCDSKQKGMDVHSAIAVTEDGLPLGMIQQESITRASGEGNPKDKEALKKRPIEEKV